MSAETNKAVVRRFNREVIEERNLSVVDELFAPGFINHSAKEGFSSGVESMTGFLALFWKAFTDLRVDIEDQLAEGDRVSSRKTIRGIHTGTFLDMPATGKEVAIRVFDIVRLESGKYVEHWNIVDMQDVLK